MPYTKIWIHLIWSTKNREPIIYQELRPKLFHHIRENAKIKGIYFDTINGYLDHVHVLLRLKPDQSVAKVAQLLKGESSHWVNDQKLTGVKFEWQDEYIALSVSESLVDKVREYIKNQEKHHQKKTFAEEYEQFMKKYGFDEGG